MSTCQAIKKPIFPFDLHVYVSTYKNVCHSLFGAFLTRVYAKRMQTWTHHLFTMSFHLHWLWKELSYQLTCALKHSWRLLCCNTNSLPSDWVGANHYTKINTLHHWKGEEWKKKSASYEIRNKTSFPTVYICVCIHIKSKNSHTPFFFFLFKENK